MSVDVSCEGDKKASKGFSNIERMQFRSLTYEIIEELRMRRDLDVENERKIQLLLQDKFELGRKLDVELGKLTNNEEQHEAELRETRRHMEDKMREFQIDASQQQVSRKIAEKENEALKDEIRKLQLTNYSLQKQIREYESHEKVQATEREQHIRQMSQFETQFKQVTNLTKEVTGKLTKLEKDMKEVQHLNHLLRYQNHHHKCILKLKNADISRLQEELVNKGVTDRLTVRGDQDREAQLAGEITLLKEKLVSTQKLYDDLAKESDSWKNRYWDSLKTLEEAHRLVSVNLHNAAQYKTDCEAAEEETKRTVEKLERAEADLNDVSEKLENLRLEKDKAFEEWKSKKSELKSEIETISENLATQRESCTALETVVTQNKQEKAEMQTELDKLQAILNRERSEFCGQTELSLLCMTDTDIQTCVDLTEKEIQTDSKDLSTCYVQTINAAICSSSVQTDEPETTEQTSSEAQTDLFETVSMETQTDKQDTVPPEEPESVLVMCEKEIQTEDEEPNKSIQTGTNMDSQTKEHIAASCSSSTPGDCSRNKDSESIGGPRAEPKPATYIKEEKLTTRFIPNTSDTQLPEPMSLAETEVIVGSHRKKSQMDIAESQKPVRSTKAGSFEDRLITNSLCEVEETSGPDFNVGISVRDMNVSPANINLGRYVNIDPEDYALTLTPQVREDQPIRTLNTADFESEESEILIGQINNKEPVEVIDDSDSDDIINPTQPGHKIKQGRESNTEMGQGLKHKLSLSDKQANSFETFVMGQSDRETVADCSAAKQMKLTDEHVIDTDFHDTKTIDNNGIECDSNNIRLSTQNLSTLKKKNRVVIRSGQKIESSGIGMQPAAYDFIRSEEYASSSFPELSKTGLQQRFSQDSVPYVTFDSTNSDSSLNCTALSQPSCQEAKATSDTMSSTDDISRPMSLVSLGNNLCPDQQIIHLSTSSNTFDEGNNGALTTQPNTQQKQDLSTPLLRTSATSSLVSGTSSLGSKLMGSGHSAIAWGSAAILSKASTTTMSESVVLGNLGSIVSSSSYTFGSSSITSSSSESAIQSQLTATRSGTSTDTSSTTSRSKTSASSLRSAEQLTTQGQSATDATRNTASSLPSAKPSGQVSIGEEGEPSFLQKYREIVSKIKPVAAPQGTTRASARKGKQLYSSSLTPSLLQTGQTKGEPVSQFSADCLTTPKSSLRGILKGSTAKEKGSKSVSWNS